MAAQGHRRHLAVARGGLAGAALVCALAVPGTAQEAKALLDRYELCLGQQDSGVCAGMLAAFCLDRAGDIDGLSACRAAQATALEARVEALVGEIGSAGGPAARRVALERMREADRSVARNCDAYAEATPQADTPHHGVRCALIAAHLKMVYIHGLRADLEPEL